MASKVIIRRKRDETPQQTTGSCSCNSDCCDTNKRVEPYIIGYVKSAIGSVPQVSTALTFKDKLDSFKVRIGIGRMTYTVTPGLYCVGNADESSPVLVTANYKMSFDSLRVQLTDIDAWILVLDTKGVNVWCAAGKGTFATKELVHRIEETKLKDIVNHKTLILPQLGATGVAAHEVAKKSGFKVKFGPVRASDIKAYIDAGYTAATEMRTVKFTLIDRIVLTPVEIVAAIKPLTIFFGILFILNCIGIGKFGFVELYAFVGAVFTGCVLTPVLLPYIPGKAFSFKGFLIGMIWAIAVIGLNGWLPAFGFLRAAAFILILPVISAYLSLNFTGCSTYTSPSGVNKEMRIALPLMLISSIIGVVILITDLIIKALN
jgi:hypothetical protein